MRPFLQWRCALLCLIGVLFSFVQPSAGRGFMGGSPPDVTFLKRKSGEDAVAGGPGNAPKQQAFVCVTGMLARVELQNKLRTLFAPLDAAFPGQVDATFVVSPAPPRYTNAKDGYHQRATDGFTDAANVTGALLDSGTVRSVDVLLRHQVTTENVPEFAQYLRKLDKGRSEQQQRERAANHYRQYEALQQCYNHMLELEKAHNGTRTKYDYIFRVRDDRLFAKPFDFASNSSELLPLPEGPSLCVPPEMAYKGYCDHWAWLRREAAEGYFNAPLNNWGEDLCPFVKNPETYLRCSYQRAGLHVWTTEQGVHGVVQTRKP